MKDGLQVSVLTPTGRGAVAVLALEGSAASEVVGDRFTNAQAEGLKSCDRMAFGRWRLDAAAANTAGTEEGRLEEVVVRRCGPTAFEVHTHGGSAVVEAVAESAQQAARRLGWKAERGDWTAWLARREPDRWIRAAEVGLAQATTERCAAILLDQCGQAGHRAWVEMMQGLKSEDGQRRREAVGKLRRMWELAAVGRRLVRPWKVVLAGRPNVGKSSLLNALLGYERAIVFNEPGTTRDAVAAPSAVEGWPVEFCDTAGLRQAVDPLESAGVDVTRRRSAEADLILQVVDSATPEGKFEDDVAWDFGDVATLTVWTKCDLPRRAAVPEGTVLVSAVTGEGLPALLAVVARWLVPQTPEPGEAVPVTEEQAEALEEAVKCLEDGATELWDKAWQVLDKAWQGRLETAE